MKTVITNHTLKIYRKVLWSDSTTVLSWLRSDPRRHTQFVGFRIGEILEATDIEEWRWVPTKRNVADEATKWGTGPDIEPNSRWFKGPSFLYEDEDYWPRRDLPLLESVEELRPGVTYERLNHIRLKSQKAENIRLNNQKAENIRRLKVSKG